MNKEIIDSTFDKIKAYSKLEFPKYEIPSIPEEGLVLSVEDNLITLQEGDYDKCSKTLYFNNGDKFNGEIINKGEKYCLVEGKYQWKSGQIFEGKFSEDNTLKLGELRNDSYYYRGNFIKGIINGKGKFNINENDFVEGKFENGYINGYAFVKKENYIIKGNFVESKPDGKIDEFNLDLDNHNYKFKNFNYKKGNILEEQIEFKKDQQNKYYIKKIENINQEFNIEEFIIEDEELSNLEACLNLMDIKLPKFELPKFHKEGLILESEEYPIIKFKNGVEADINDDEDEQKLNVSNGEKFVGRLNYIEEPDKEIKYYLKEGKYSWPSGQIYEGKFENNKFEALKEKSKLSKGSEWNYKGKFKNGEFYEKGILEYNGKRYEGYFENNKITGNTTITYNNIKLTANIQSSLISGIVAEINGKKYKINNLYLNNNMKEPVIIYREDETTDTKYTILLYNINNKKIKFEKVNTLPKNEFENIFNILNNIINLPIFESIPLDENSLKIKIDENKKNKLSFKNYISYDGETKILSFPNEESFKGTLIQKGNKYYLDYGEYEWPSGQKYIGIFSEYNFDSGEGKMPTLITNSYKYVGGFLNGLPNGDGEITYENGNIIRGKFINGKNYGNTYVKNENISFEANYAYSLITEYIKNIKIIYMDKEYNDILNIEKGKIKETMIKIDDEEFELTEKNRTLLSEEEYVFMKSNLEDILFLFKYICKFRKFSLPSYEQPRIADDGIYIEKINSLENIKLSFPNEENFVGKIEKVAGDKYMLTEGEYSWINGQKYIGKFSKNRFNDEKGKLIYPEQNYYEGGFKNGLFNGNGKYINKNNDTFEGIFEEGELNDLIFKKKNLEFEGKNLDSIKDINIKLFKIRTNEHLYEISEFKISNQVIKYKKDKIEFKIDFSQELKQKIVGILLVKNRNAPNLKNYFYNNRYIKDLSNENKLKILKIENNIYSKKLSKISIYQNRLADDNRNKKNEFKKIIGNRINDRMTIQEIDCRLNSVKNLRKKINNNVKLRKSINNCDFGEIEKNEISRIFNHQMLKEMKKEIDLLKKDIITLKDEKKIIEKERINRHKEYQDLNLYFELINNNYIQLTKEKNKIEEETKEIQEELKQIINENNLLNKYLRKNSGKIINKCEIKRNIKEIEIDNNRIINEINEKEKRINEQNKEKAELLKQIENLQNAVH